ncbi:polymer-forming cytoskeletal protein [Corallococcus sp. M34]|uniref:polymer-forming cytoskeletal protein n=1 Tax=Citreicoccus inhibens TaxID=2849499 RepID=UPI001C24D23D|nr:polymer-forming cytoskeletal protein [Citreicoccus inhibens]MBU8894626.1 polymer-forming cytoskeletal protein [Citreicoccus inhibens]
MRIPSRLVVSALLLGAPLALGAESPTPAPAVAAAAPTIDVSYRGTLRDALKAIAEKGGINIVVTGALDTPAEVRLRGVTAEQALRTVARAYSLRIDADGSIYTLRPMTAQEQSAGSAPEDAAPVAPPAPPAPPKPAAVAAQGGAKSDDAAPENEDLEDIRQQVREAVREKLQQAQNEVRGGRRGSKNVVARGQSLEVKEGETVESAVVYGGNLLVNGHVEDDAVAFGGTLEIRGHVEGDAHAFGGNVILGPDAVVEGDVSAFGGTVQKSEGAKVDGSTESFGGAGIGRVVAGELKEGLRELRNGRHLKSRDMGKHSDSDDSSSDADEDDDNGRSNGFASFILQFAVLFGLGFLGQLFFPTRMKELGEEIRTRPLQSGMAGFLGAIALVPLTLVLIITLIGIPVAVLLWIVAPLAAALGYAAVASEVGTRLPVMRGRKTQAVVLALGLSILLALGHVPVLGWLANIAAILAAFGAVIRTRFGQRLRGIPEPIFRDENTVQPG